MELKPKAGMNSDLPPASAGLAELSSAGEAGLRMWLDSSRNLLDGFAGAQAESLCFWRDRLEAWRETSDRIGTCREPQEVLRIQTEFADEMMRAYAAFWPKVLGLMAGSVSGPAPSEAGKAGLASSPPPRTSILSPAA